MKEKFYLIAFLLSMLFPAAANAQGLCDIGGGNFEISATEGCAPLAVTIKNNVPNPITVLYAVAYDGSENPAYGNYRSYTYSAGEYTILQYGAVTSGLFSACKKIKVYEVNPPEVNYASCGGGKVKLILAQNYYLDVYEQVEIKWGDGQTHLWKRGDAPTLDHTYASTAGNPVISITGKHPGSSSCKTGITKTIPVSFQQAQLNDVQISSVEMKGNGSIELNYFGVTAVTTGILYSSNGTDYTTYGIRTFGGSKIFYRMDNLNAGQIYQLKLSSLDLCGENLDSEIVTSMVLQGKSEDEKNVLSWNKYPENHGFIEYELFRDGISVKKLGINETTFTDDQVQCGDQFEYKLVAKTQKATSTAAPVIVKTEIAQPKPITQAFVTVADHNLITVNAVIPGAGPRSTYELSIERAEAGTNTFRKITTLFTQNEYSDSDVKANELSYCYRLSYQNACGQKLPSSEPICSLLLKNDLSTFTWTADKPFLDGVASYTVIQKGISGSLSEIGAQLKTSFIPVLNRQSDLEYTFQVRANSLDGNFQSLSNLVSYKRNIDVFVPDAFSPNGDSVNDHLIARASGLQSFSFSVLNRWGKVIFHSNDLQTGWDGKINGENAPVGSYVYKISFVDDINQKIEKRGTFVLLR
jgi:gliding motility-associated-like protein